MSKYIHLLTISKWKDQIESDSKSSQRWPSVAIKPMMLDLSPPQLAAGGRRPSLDFKAELYSENISLVTMNHAGVEHNCNIIRYGKTKEWLPRWSFCIMIDILAVRGKRKSRQCILPKRVFRY